MQVYYSPQLGSGNKNSSSFRNSGAYTSPGTPDYGDNTMLGFQKGWCSERVPLSNSSRRHISAAALMPFNSQRTLPSKWDDAERWITSPVSGFGGCKALATPPQRRAKAKSGPLGSPLTTGVLVPDGLQLRNAGVVNAAQQYGMIQSTNAPGWSELLIESAYPDSQDEKEDENGVSRVASRRDMATQMSSPETSPTHIPPPPVEPNNHHSARLEVRDVQVDKGTTTIKQSKRHKTKIKNTRSPEVNDLALTWNTTEGAMKVSKLEKEEARITAWENLQNAKAEASIRKLEMKLEKKKSASLDKILNKHRAAQMKADEMRRNMSEDVSPRTSRKFKSLRRFVPNSLKGCFHHHGS
ncbi:putative remorin [Helianthus annuus]|uniref:Remorin n=1 Tax=Helianthus annuus TaxID=4232 RepID=A0A9K3DXZ3_HELAN|nr:remorin 1.4 isoform X2 [Helianthus annuus]KAF5763665.1 putative remorin [Helianthus annuus]KAJ0472290.1 putative remorin [Helianthus annuus]KAJ0647888.1 putative remorin [Helianthus annuus]KAJ0651748.1 putative remorin [Helianthus annuus]